MQSRSVFAQRGPLEEQSHRRLGLRFGIGGQHGVALSTRLRLANIELPEGFVVSGGSRPKVMPGKVSQQVEPEDVLLAFEVQIV
jgi:hypothetical protein